MIAAREGFDQKSIANLFGFVRFEWRRHTSYKSLRPSLCMVRDLYHLTRLEAPIRVGLSGLIGAWMRERCGRGAEEMRKTGYNMPVLAFTRSS